MQINLGAGVCPFDPDLEPDQSEAWFHEYSKQNKYRWTPKKRGKNVLRLATLDAETDPFAGPNQPIVPFCWGFYDGAVFKLFWGDNATVDLCAYIRSLDYPHVIYAHNGGKFDFTFLLDLIEPDVFTIGTRIVKASVQGDTGLIHELRDSFAIIPESLGDAAEKHEFNYDLMKRGIREKHKPAIIEYLKQDCVGLYDTVEKFRGEFGDVLTMASASMKKLNLSMAGKSRKGAIRQCYERLTEDQDATLRPYYYGGHVECFKRGIFQAPPNETYKLFDINSSYANVMRNFLHPTSAGYTKGLKSISDRTDFCLIDATSHGALPLRNNKTKELLFPHGRFIFQATGHEVRTALSLGLLHIHKLHDAWEAFERKSFGDFIDHYYRVRLEARAAGDKVFALFWKRVMNGAYGKFAQDPRKFKDTMIVRPWDEAPDIVEGWSLAERYQLLDIWQRQSDQTRAFRSFLNVGTGASITGAARAELLKGIHRATNVLYCDTDSVIATAFSGLQSDIGLGSWKVETEAHKVAIVDKKTYAMWGQPATGPEGDQRLKAYGDTSCVKLASKGVRATAGDVLNLARGNEVEFIPLAPTFKIDGSQVWTTRRLKRRDLPVAEAMVSERSLALQPTLPELPV